MLIYLTHNERKGLVTVTELAERFKWSRNHMVKVVHFMSTKNWVQTHRGRFGGLTLKMHPSEYKIGDIVQILEEQGELIDCFEPHECALAKCCKLRSLLNEATRDFYSRLNTATLETLTNSDEIISGKDLLRAQPDAPTPPSSELIRLAWRRASPANSARPDSNASAALIAQKSPARTPAGLFRSVVFAFS
ncbi:MAG: RrF2 family transcriptional regulator [Sutterella wadsworthensis]